MLKQVDTLVTLKEMKTDGHAPVLFHCSDGNNYYCKYRIYPAPKEINCLAFEIIATTLLQELKIPTPEIALVTIMPDTLNWDIIKTNQRMKAGIIVFGSKEEQPTRLVDEFAVLNSKNDFNELLNPEDIIRIALFDLWIKNKDRGRWLNPGYNYNLLLRRKYGKEEIIAFDHAFCFGGNNPIGDFSPNESIIGVDNLYQTTFFQSIVKYIERLEYNRIINKFVTLLHNDTTNIIQDTLKQLPPSWDLLDNLEKRVTELLNAHNRIEIFAKTLLNAKK